ncbi:acyltransferase [Colletotrichum falcatum]|nr:acyltransferase [Colletotrichum falcatum]
MPKEEFYDLHPFGWESDPEVERSKLSALDYTAVMSYNHFALFFRLDDAAKPGAVETLKAGLERTLAQVRHLNGRIEKDPRGGHSFTKRKDDTVRFVVQWLDDPEDAGKYPSFDDMERAHFTALSLGDPGLWAVEPMTYGYTPEAALEQNPVTSAFKANFVRGGLVLSTHSHHAAADVMGWAGFVHQLAENCCALATGAAYPAWDPACLGISRLLKPEPPEELKVEGPPPSDMDPGHLGCCSSYLFHLPKSKAARLKELARPEDGTWVSTYDAFSAFIWRHLTRLRAPAYNPAPDSKLLYAETVDMRRRMHSPKPPARIQQNFAFVALSRMAPVVQPTVSELISEWPFWKVARYIRQLTDSVTQERLDVALTMAAMIRDKSSLSIRPHAGPPMAVGQTDQRSAEITTADFGFAKPATYRYLVGEATNNLIFVYPSRDPSPESDEGSEFVIMYETDLAQALIDDPIWNQFFEYRGINSK